jgi:hypothetical protein
MVLVLKPQYETYLETQWTSENRVPWILSVYFDGVVPADVELFWWQGRDRLLNLYQLQENYCEVFRAYSQLAAEARNDMIRRLEYREQ